MASAGCVLRDGDPPMVDVVLQGATHTDTLKVSVKIARVDGGDIQVRETYTYEPGGATGANDRIGIYYHGALVWGIEP
jgi:hypothetical protein